ncbi:hypothetical protein AVEN_197335-1 [Araneus ventricosus]|uniref:Uncharacterized protein n=1 Tax=Araneus ventricosus TaxID=182803 RepID=A0A4Y2IUD2_ARAVE|nr:hypothetical protein AVEN_197335-1 [Araneus ventricosus]
MRSYRIRKRIIAFLDGKVMVWGKVMVGWKSNSFMTMIISDCETNDLRRRYVTTYPSGGQPLEYRMHKYLSIRPCAGHIAEFIIMNSLAPTLIYWKVFVAVLTGLVLLNICGA